MPRIDSTLITPIYVKDSDNMPAPRDPVYYLIASNNLYLCRNHPHFQSCVPAPRWPTELAAHAASLVSNYPRIPRDQIERICGFFGYMSFNHSAEAIALLAWDKVDQRVRTVVPRQVSAVSRAAWGESCPIGVRYRLPGGLPKHWDVFGDVHSHCDMAAYASQTDIADEDTMTGLHIVVGRLHHEPPEFHVEVVVDGTRFPIRRQDALDGYRCRAPFPAEWLNRVAVTNYAAFRNFDFDDEPAQTAEPRQQGPGRT